MKKLLLLLMVTASMIAHADMLRIEKDIVLKKYQDSTYRSFREDASFMGQSICNIHVYIGEPGDETILIEKGELLDITTVNENSIYSDFDGDAKAYEVTSITAKLSFFNSYLVAICRAEKGSKTIPNIDELLEVFADSITLHK